VYLKPVIQRFLILATLSLAASATAQQSYNNDSIIKLVKAGLSDDLIISTIEGQAGHYDTTPDGIIALKAAGVSDKIVAAIVGKPSGPAQPVVAPTDLAPPGNTEPPSSMTPEQPPADLGSSKGSAPVQAGSRVVIAPMGGFETYFAAAVREKKVPIILTLDRSSAQYFVVSTNTEWQGFVYGAGGSASWNRAGGTSSYGAGASSTRGLEASIMIIEARTKDVVWAYEVHKNSHGALIFGTLGARGQQSIAEACAKHLKEYIEKGK
jgi:hypothetical protein